MNQPPILLKNAKNEFCKNGYSHICTKIGCKYFYVSADIVPNLSIVTFSMQILFLYSELTSLSTFP